VARAWEAVGGATQAASPFRDQEAPLTDCGEQVIMSTTLLAPSYYVVKPRGQTARHYLTLAQAATAIAQLAPTPTTVSAITGSRARSLSDSELRELGRRVRAYRVHASKHRWEGRRGVAITQVSGS
jgi:hypothetical protein